METKLAFFDLDGTLSVPNYYTDGRIVTGFSDKGWQEYCDSRGEDGYDHCKVVKPVKRYAERLAAGGAVLCVLSTCHYDSERKAKEKFLKVNYPGLFQKLITVDADLIKIDIIKQMAEERGLTLAECELVEDTYSTLLKANEIGIKATHISEIVCEL